MKPKALSSKTVCAEQIGSKAVIIRRCNASAKRSPKAIHLQDRAVTAAHRENERKGLASSAAGCSTSLSRCTDTHRKRWLFTAAGHTSGALCRVGRINANSRWLSEASG